MTPASEAPADATSTAGPNGHRHRARGRRIAVGVLVVLTTLGVFSSSVAVWSHRQLMNTDAWVEAMGNLVDDPQVTEALANHLTEEVFALTNAQQLAERALPEQAGFLAAPLTDAVEGFVRSKTAEFLASDTFRDLWLRLNRALHAAIVALLRGETVRGVTVDQGTVSVDLLPLITRVISFIQDKAPGLFGDRGTVPTISDSTPPAEAKSQFETWLGRPMRKDLSSVVLLRSDDLAAAQRAVAFFDTAVWVLVGLTIALLIATIVLSLDRRRTLIQLGLGTALAVALAAAVVNAVREQVLDLISAPEDRAATAAAIRELLSSLRVLERFLLVGGIATAVIAFLAGDHRWAVAFRATIGRASGAAQEAVSKHRPAAAPAYPWITDHRSGLQVAGIVVAVAVLLVTSPDWGSLLLAGLALALYEVLLVLLAGPVPTADAR